MVSQTLPLTTGDNPRVRALHQHPMKYPSRGAASVRCIRFIVQSEYRPWNKEKKIRRHHSHSMVFTLNYSRHTVAETRIIFVSRASRAPLTRVIKGAPDTHGQLRRKPIRSIRGTREDERGDRIARQVRASYEATMNRESAARR